MTASFSRRSDIKKFTSWIISAIIGLGITEIINYSIHSITTFKHIPDLVFGIFKNYNSVWSNIFYAIVFIILLLIFFVVLINVEHSVKLFLFRKQLPNTIKEFGSLKKKVNKTVIALINEGDDKHISDRDEIYADLLKQMQSEFEVEGVSIDSINKCTEALANVLKNMSVVELFALTNLYGDSWLTRNMLLYLIRTIQIADKIDDNTKKLRVFIRNDNGKNKDKKAFQSILSLHSGFLPTKEITKSEYDKKEGNCLDAFLYLKLSDNTEHFWYVDVLETKKVWAYGDTITGKEVIDKIQIIINNLKSI